MDHRITMSTNIPPAMGRKAAKAVREAVRAAAVLHHQRNIPKHFKRGAASTYGYRRRSQDYTKRVRKLYPGWLPLMRSGETAASITGARQVRVTSTRGAVLVMRAALPGFSGRFRAKVNARGRQFLSKQQEQIIARIEEIRAITTEEVEVLAKAEEKVFGRMMTLMGPTRRLI